MAAAEPAKVAIEAGGVACDAHLFEDCSANSV
ncbi:hypothetical protein A2U01_0086834, partial [Trifolium medium]|nr:hypothetical protein [Trifolium medium]